MWVMMLGIFAGLSGCGRGTEWRQLTLSRTHMNAAGCYYLQVNKEDDGRVILTGYLTDSDGREYFSESGIVLSEQGVSRLREMKLTDLPDQKKRLRPMFTVSDETMEKLILRTSDGKKIQKELTEDTLTEMFILLLGEFKDSTEDITEFEEILLKVSGMRGTAEYEFTGSGEDVVLSRYRMKYVDGKEVREPDGRRLCEREAVLDLLEACGVRDWNGFAGNHPENILDGDIFSFRAEINGRIIQAEGSANYPEGYKDFLHKLNQWLAEK